MHSLIILNANICDINCMVVMCYFIVLNANVWDSLQLSIFLFEFCN